MKLCVIRYPCKRVTSYWGDHDRNAIHDGVKNRYTSVTNDKTITLIPLPPKQVYND
jgi:hypothetical protein